MIHKKMIYKVVGYLLLIETALMLLCGCVTLYYHEDDLNDFLLTAGICTLVGGILAFMGRHAEHQLTRRDGYIIVSISWVMFSLFGMLPFYLSGYIPSITNAFFETMSGVSSTGATILDEIEVLPHGLLFWRSLTQWIGGLGIILFTIAVLPIFGINGVQVFAAEATGPTHDKVHPRISLTARWIWAIYSGMTLICACLLIFGGMSWFDAICHSFTATSTGGYSTHTASVAFYNSPYIEYVLIAFMFLSSINFTLLLFVCTGKLKKAFTDAELRFYVGMVAFFTVIITIILYEQRSMDAEAAFRTSLFQVLSIQTSTGFVTSDYMTWPAVAWGIMPILMIVGACAGSTSGGMKCIRWVIFSKVTKNEFKRLLHPNAVLPVRVNKQVITPAVQSTVLAFTILFIFIAFTSILILMGLGLEFTESIGVTVSSLGNTGPGLGAFGPAFSWNALPDAAKWLASFLMLLGRLELFTVLLMFTPEFWRRS